MPKHSWSDVDWRPTLYAGAIGGVLALIPGAIVAAVTRFGLVEALPIAFATGFLLVAGVVVLSIWHGIRTGCGLDERGLPTGFY